MISYIDAHKILRFPSEKTPQYFTHKKSTKNIYFTAGRHTTSVLTIENIIVNLKMKNNVPIYT